MLTDSDREIIVGVRNSVIKQKRILDAIDNKDKNVSLAAIRLSETEFWLNKYLDEHGVMR